MTETVNEILEWAGEMNPEALYPTGLEDAVIGMDHNSNCIILDHEKCIEIFMQDDEMTREDAMEHMDFNVTGAYVGEYTPIFMIKPEI